MTAITTALDEHGNKSVKTRTIGDATVTVTDFDAVTRNGSSTGLLTPSGAGGRSLLVVALTPTHSDLSCGANAHEPGERAPPKLLIRGVRPKAPGERLGPLWDHTLCT